MSNQYHIETMDDIIALTKEQRERMVVDLLAWCNFVDKFKVALAGVPVTHGFTWVDDDRPGELSGINIEFVKE